MIRGLAKRRLHCILKPCLETNLLYLLLPKQFRSPAPSSTRKKQQLPTPHHHHSRPEMNSMPGRSRQHQPSLLLGLPQDLCIEIVARVDATSKRPLPDLRSLCGTCSTMRRVCGHSDVGRRLSIKGIRDEISCVWDPTAYKAFFAMMTSLGNLEACFISRIKAVFMENKGCNDLPVPPRVGRMR
jgi:hypothetical protein